MNIPTKHTIWKTAANGLFAHIYEHWVAQKIDEIMQASGYLLVVDYSLWGTTYGTSCFIDFSSHKSAVVHLFYDTISTLQDKVPTLESIQIAALECACEYERPLMKLEGTVINDIAQIHQHPWKLMREFTTEQAQLSTSVNTLFELPGIRFGRHNQQSFLPIVAHYTMPPHVYEKNPGLKALSVILIQVLALNFNAYLKKESAYYDGGDQWNEGAETVEYETLIVSPKKTALSEAHVLSLFRTYIHTLQRGNFAEKLASTIANDYASDPSLVYFDKDILNRITGGVLIGGQGWETITNPSIIRRLLKSVSVSFAKAD